MATWKMADSNTRPQKADTTAAAAAASYTRSLHVAANSITTSNSNSDSETTQQQNQHQQNFRSRFSVHQRETKQIGPIRIQSAVASFVFKGEDRFDMWRCTNFSDSCSTSIIEDEHSDDDDDDDANSSNNTSSSSSKIKIKSKLDRAKQRYCGSPAAPTAAAPTATATAASPPPISPVRDDHISIGSREDGIHVISNNTNSRSRPQLLAYAGVFDGHSGHAASEYCANKGLLSHIILETAQSTTTTTTTTTSSTNTRTNSNRRAIGGGGVHNKPNIEVPWLNQNLHYTKTTATAATSTQDVGNKINNNIDDKDWCPIQNALQETVSKLASSPLEVAHARAFCSAQTRFASGSTPLTLKQVAEKVSEMNKQQQQQQQQRRNDARLTFKQLVMQVIEMNYKQQQERRNAFKQLVKQVIEMNKQQQQRRSGGYYTRRGAAVAAAAVTAAGSNNTLSSSPGFKGLLRRRSGSMEHETDIPGGTTACTLSIYCQEEEEEGEIGAFGEDEVSVHDDDDDDDCVRLSVFAVVANCGDSRLITDHGTGGTSYHAITTDHRPNEPSEAVRLAECCKRGYGHLSCQRWTPATTNQGDLQWLHSPVERLFPGGLAVSRTIGDTSYCKAAVPVPDVYRLCLVSGINSIPTTTTTAIKLASPNNRRSLLTSAASTPTFAGSRRSVMSACTTSTADSTGGAGHARTHRFVLATDGLWDMLTIQEVGILAARQSHAHDDEHEVAEEVPTHVSAMRIMQECLTVCQETGHYDDITIVVIDVTV